MTGQDDRHPHGSGPDEPVDQDAVDEEIGALLADLRVSGPVPDDVAARLDDVLAGLVAQREQESGVGAEPVELASRRPRRTWWAAAAAAAVVVVAGGVVLPELLTGESAGTMANETVDRGDGAGSARPPVPAEPEGLVALTRDGLDAQVRAYAATLDGTHAARPPAAADAVPDRGIASRAPDLPCPWDGGGTLVPATLEGSPATLVLRPRRGTALVVTCETGPSRVAETVTLD